MEESNSLQEEIRNSLLDAFKLSSSDTCGKEYSSSEIMKFSGVSRQTLRMAINNQLITPTYKKSGKKEFMYFSYEDILTMCVIDSLIDLGIKMEDSRKSTGKDTVVDIFRKADNNLAKIIKQSEDSIAERVNNVYYRTFMLWLISNFDLMGLGGENAIRSIYAGYNTANSGSKSYSNPVIQMLEAKISQMVASISEDSEFSVDNYSDYVKDYFVNESTVLADSELYAQDYRLQELLQLYWILNSDMMRGKLFETFSKAKIENMLSVVEMAIDKYVDAEGEDIDEFILDIKPLFEIIPERLNAKDIDKILNCFDEKLNNRLDDNLYSEDTSESPIAVQALSQLLISITEDGDLGKWIEKQGGQGTLKKIKEIAASSLSSMITPLVDRVTSLVEELAEKECSDAEAIYRMLEEIIKYYEELILPIDTELFFQTVDIILDSVKEEVASDPYLKDYWEYSKDKILRDIREKHNVAGE